MTAPAGSKRIELQTREGELVHVTYLPAFARVPEVLIWGDRLFRQALDEGRYTECAYYLIPLREAWGEPARYDH